MKGEVLFKDWLRNMENGVQPSQNRFPPLGQHFQVQKREESKLEE